MFAPGSFLWLLRHDVRLNWRRFAGMLGAAGRAKPWIIGLGAAGIAHLMAWPVALWLAPRWNGAAVDAETQGALIALSLSIFCWMVAQSLFGVMRTLYDRGDLDLLMGSPLSVRKVFAAKAVSVVGSTLGSIAVLALPLANMGAALDRLSWLALYPTLLALALIAAAIAFFIGMALFFRVGPARARLLLQLTGAIVGGGFVLVAQIVILLPDTIQDDVLGWLAESRSAGSTVHLVLGAPLAAAMGDPTSVVALLLAGLALFAAAVLLLSERFAGASLAAVGSAQASSRAADSARPVVFRAGASASLRRKEWRLLMRDPSLFAQLSLQIVYTIPLIIVLLKSGTLPIGIAVAPALVVIAAQVSASLAWLTVSGEDAPELIASAPVAPRAVDRAKLLSIALPVLALMVLPVLALALISPLAGLAALLLASGACASTAFLNLWHPMPGNRRGMLRRHSQSKLLALIEHIIAVLWAVATVLLLLGTVWGLLPIAMATGVLLASSPRRTGRTTRLSFDLAARLKPASPAPSLRP